MACRVSPQLTKSAQITKVGPIGTSQMGLPPIGTLPTWEDFCTCNRRRGAIPNGTIPNWEDFARATDRPKWEDSQLGIGPLTQMGVARPQNPTKLATQNLQVKCTCEQSYNGSKSKTNRSGFQSIQCCSITGFVNSCWSSWFRWLCFIYTEEDVH